MIMNRLKRRSPQTRKLRPRLFVALAITLVPIHNSSAQTPAQSNRKEIHVTTQDAQGAFDVKMAPLTLDDKTAESTLGRMSLDKQYHGDLEASAKGEMLSAMTSVKGSAGYVAIEHVDGTLSGRKGSFVLQHTGTMTRGQQSLSVSVVPDSGTGQLTGISGTMVIDIADGKHSYTFNYTLPD